MSENQNVEWKESWRDEYLKWIAAFANANGGTLCVGMDDKGVVVGLTAFEKHLEEIPNKIKDVLGILADVNLRSTESKHYIEIVVDHILIQLVIKAGILPDPVVPPKS